MKTVRLPSFSLGATQELADVLPIVVGPSARISVQCVIDGGSEGAVPADNPLSTWRLYCAGDEAAPFADVSARETFVDELAAIAPNGNALVNAYAVFTDVPGSRAKLVYVRSSGGATARARLWITSS